MKLYTPRFLNLAEADPNTVAQFHVVARDTTTQEEVAGANYACSPSQPQTIPIGSNGFFDNVPEGTGINLFVLEIPVPTAGPNTEYQQVPGGPWVVRQQADGVETLSVTV